MNPRMFDESLREQQVEAAKLDAAIAKGYRILVMGFKLRRIKNFLTIPTLILIIKTANPSGLCRKACYLSTGFLFSSNQG